MQYKVPQDVQREDQIIGPLTLKQLIILGCGGGLAYAIYVSLSRTYFIEIWLPPVGIISALTLAFAFLKIHSLPFHEFLMNFIEFHMLPKKRVWIQGSGKPFISDFNSTNKEKEPVAIKQETSKEQKTIEELTTILDTGGKSELSRNEKKEKLQNMIKQNYI